MTGSRVAKLTWAISLLALLVLIGGAAPAESAKPTHEAQPDGVPEVKNLLANLVVDPPRKHKNMLVFPIRYPADQAPGKWITMDDAVAAGHLKISEKHQAAVPEVLVENTGDRTVFLMSGEIIKGGKQTRVVKKDTIVEAKQKVTVPVYCIEQRRWAGEKHFRASHNIAPMSVQLHIKRGAGQAKVWDSISSTGRTLRLESSTGSLDEILDSAPVQKSYEELHEDLGKFSPPDTIGIAVADSRTGRVLGLELFGRRSLFENLQDKLVEGYATDLVIMKTGWPPTDSPAGPPTGPPTGPPAGGREITQKHVHAFIQRAGEATSKYEDTPGSGRGIDLHKGSIHGKGVALGEHVIHLSVQDTTPAPTPARPIVDDPRPRPILPRN